MIEKLRHKLVELKKAHSENSAGVTTCFQTMQKYLANVYRDPEQDRFRSIRLSNAAFQQRVAAFTGSIEVLELCGFKVSLCLGLVMLLHALECFMCHFCMLWDVPNQVVIAKLCPT